MASAEDIKNYINRFDRFAAANNIRLTRVERDFAEAELIVTPEMLNGNDVVQGGAIFTLADIAFAGAANSENRGMVTQSCTMSFVRPGSGRCLTATAKSSTGDAAPGSITSRSATIRANWSPAAR